MTTLIKQPILVTGSHRSGSTWVGKMHSLSSQVGYIHEPFNPALRDSVSCRVPSHWFQYYDHESCGDFYAAMERVLGFRYPLLQNLMDPPQSVRALGKVVREQYRFTNYRRQKARPLVKDPIALFSAEWLSHAFEMKILVMIRHPAAFCSSLKVKGWRFDFNQFLEQPELMERYLDHYTDLIRAFSKDEKSVIEQSVLLWNITHHVIYQYKEKHPEWMFLRHEDLSFDPVGSFRSIYEELDLDFSAEVESKIIENTGGNNPAEQEFRRNLQRDSKKNIHNWKKRLTEEEINYIQSETRDVSSLFYNEDKDW